MPYVVQKKDIQMKIPLKFTNYDDVFERLIMEEEEALDIYNALIGKCQNHELRKVFFQFVQEETKHIEDLKRIREKYPVDNFSSPVKVVVDRDLGNWENLDSLAYIEVLKFAKEEERKTMKLYQDIAAQVKDKEVEQLFLSIAEEERIHYQRTKEMYDSEK